MRIAIDAMGGDHAPHMNVEGAIQAAKTWKDIHIMLVGNRDIITPLLNEALDNMEVVHAEEVILADDEPVKAVRRKKQSSMVVAGRMVRDQEADAMISSGNTGALMATGLLVIGRMEGIERPALAPMLPTMDGRGVIALDLGANMDASADHLLQYAKMGSIYRKMMDRIDKPRVGLLNVGTEEAKGNELTKTVFPLLQAADIHFVGNVEARDVLQGECDVLICDGFVGNIMLKTMEGTAESIFASLRNQFTSSWHTKLAAAWLKPGLRRLKKKLDYTETGGAPLLGVQGVCIKGHGSSDANAMKNAVRQARLALLHEIVPTISSEFNEE